MFLIIDNYDSFVHNLARYIALAGCTYKIFRNDQITTTEIQDLNPDAIVLSPGPCTPQESGICVDAIKTLGATLPILGICLGHQCIGEAYGAKTVQADTPTHGKATSVKHDGTALFNNIPSPFMVGRYHSLIVKPEHTTPLHVIAHGPDREIMGIKHNQYPVYGLQFHPESILTEHGLTIIKNFKTIVDQTHKDLT